MANQSFTYRRTELYDLVWAEPVTTIAKRFGVSNTAVAKVCRRLVVPLPQRGHWSKTRAGKAPPKPPLPPLPDGVPEEITVEQNEQPKAIVPVEATVVVEPDRGADAKLTVSPVLTEPHRLVAKAEKLLRRAKVDSQNGLVTCRGERCLDVRVSPEQLDRALRIMDAVLKGLAARGLKLEITEPIKFDSHYNRLGDKTVEPNATRVQVAGEWVMFGLVERLTTAQPQPPKGLSGAKLKDWQFWNSRRVFVPKGVLQLSVKDAEYLGVRTAWMDGKRQRLEACVDDFVDNLQAVAQGMKDRRAEDERRRLEREEQQRQEWEAQRRRMEEDQRAREFQEQLDRWRLARDYRAYVLEARRIAEDAGCSIVAGGRLDASLKWALEHADRIDPLSPLRREIAASVAKREADAAEQAPQAGEASTETGSLQDG